MDELAQVRSFRASVSGPSPDVVAAARRQMLAARQSRRPVRKWAIPRRRILVVVIALTFLLGGAGVVAAGLFGDGILTGPSAPKENDAALQALFPPFHIGHATELATFEGRKLFGAHTANGGYCFSATSPTDPKGEGGHCVSDAEARTLNAGGTVAFAMSGWSVGGYAPGASKVRVSGAGIDVTVPVATNGWWLGIAKLPDPPLPDGQDQAFVVATSIGPDGGLLGHDPLMRVHRVRTPSGRLIGFSFALD